MLRQDRTFNGMLLRMKAAAVRRPRIQMTRRIDVARRTFVSGCRRQHRPDNFAFGEITRAP
jgi:hypothetical protein